MYIQKSTISKIYKINWFSLFCKMMIIAIQLLLQFILVTSFFA